MNIKSQMYCGPMGFDFNAFFQSKPSQYPALTWLTGNEIYYVHRTRTAIYHLRDLLGWKANDEVLMPAYNCGSEVDAIIKSGLSVNFYRVDSHANIDIKDIVKRVSSKTKAIYIIHYFGFPHEIKDLLKYCKNNNLILIEDSALSLFSYDKDVKIGSLSDVSLANFTKSLPVPDGGALVINNEQLIRSRWKLKRPQVSIIALNLLSLVKHDAIRFLNKTKVLFIFVKLAQSLSILPKSYSMISAKQPRMPNSYYFDPLLADRDISYLSKRLLERIDYKKIFEKRRKNYLLLLSIIQKSLYARPLYNELHEGVCPLVLPVIIKNRDEVCRALNKKFIHAIPWWSGYHSELTWDQFEEAQFLKDNLLALPIHQDLNDEDIHFVGVSLIQELSKCY